MSPWSPPPPSAERARPRAASKTTPSKNFIEIPDYHSACIVASMTGTPLHKLKAGPRDIAGERVQVNPDPLERYRKALGTFVDNL